MATLLLIIIYLAFISLGLPDSLLGAAWPIMHIDLNSPFSYAGFVSIIASGGTIVSSLASGFVLKKFGVGKVTVVSVLLTAAALLGIAFTPSFLWLCLLAIPLGIGAGSVDSGLNSFVASHYKARHMSWLHCFWGVGASCGPLIMAFWIAKDGQWRNGYLSISVIQFVLVGILFVSLPLWKRFDKSTVEAAETPEAAIESSSRRVSLVPALLSFFCYCAVESTTGLWGASYLVMSRGLDVATAASWVSMFYIGITLGRFFSGFLTIKLSSPSLIRLGVVICIGGIVLLMLPLPAIAAFIALWLIGLGLAPIFPSMLQETPARFGLGQAQKAMGFQMACAYAGATFMPPIFGLIASNVSTWFLPYWQIGFVVVLLICTEVTNSQMHKTIAR